MTDDIAELVQDYLAGETPEDFVFNLLTRWMATRGVGVVAERLPPAMLDDFIAWARPVYDNDAPVEDFVWMGSAEPSWFRSFIPVMREWLREQP